MAQAGGGDVAGWRRAVDVVGGATLALVTLPLLLVSLLGSAVALRAWPLFTQDRIGRDGKRFRFVKIRTLPTTAPAYADKLHLDLAHVPRFCRLLRAWHLDELPQLYLVLDGRMSLVGPRPEMPWLHDNMAPSFAAERTSVRPGCTGLWQISQSCAGLIEAAPEYDRFYLEHRTLRLDAWVLFRTALKMVHLTRPVTLADVPAWTLRRPPVEIAEAQVADAEPAAERPQILSSVQA